MRPNVVLPYLVYYTLLLADDRIEAIKCYECAKATSNSECFGADKLVDCTTKGPLFDTCQTIYTIAKNGTMSISKQCALSPCHLPDKQTQALALQCTSTDCHKCCHTDGCNASGQQPTLLPFSFLTYLLSATIITTCVTSFSTNSI